MRARRLALVLLLLPAASRAEPRYVCNGDVRLPPGFPSGFSICWADPASQASDVATMRLLLDPKTYDILRYGTPVSRIILDNASENSGILLYRGDLAIKINAMAPEQEIADRIKLYMTSAGVLWEKQHAFIATSGWATAYKDTQWHVVMRPDRGAFDFVRLAPQRARPETPMDLSVSWSEPETPHRAAGVEIPAPTPQSADEREKQQQWVEKLRGPGWRDVIREFSGRNDSAIYGLLAVLSKDELLQKARELDPDLVVQGQSLTLHHKNWSTDLCDLDAVLHVYKGMDAQWETEEIPSLASSIQGLRDAQLLRRTR